MSSRQLLRWLLAAGLVIVAAVGVWIVVGVATRGCSLSDGGREQLSSRLSPDVMSRVIAEVAGPSAMAPDGVLIDPAVGERNFSLDQGPQRVCASGAARVETASGTFNVLIRVYDSPDAAGSNAESNLPQAPSLSVVGAGGVEATEAVCQRRVGDECRVVGAQAVAGAVSTVVLSRSLEDSEIVRISRRVAELVSELSER